VLQKEEAERKAREEADRREKEMAERARREEEERTERRKVTGADGRTTITDSLSLLYLYASKV